ncbi:superfamily II DNA or RNA helicase [Paenibacillus sp. DS2015]|uniref:DEAD/DEAH box helicase n=1 Tax=Paenibacillus sp. DS2015 TaxID=3373917 RepID=UPI003D1A36B3
MRIDNYKPQQNVTDKINGQQTEWKNGDIVLISSGTASGKSYFIRNELEELAESEGTYILLLVNRSKLFKQNMELIGQSFLSRIKVELYQNIEREINSGKGYDFSRYKYIVCDESHYFTTDSGFNDSSDESLNAILSLHSHIRIFMSATGSILFSHIKEKHRRLLKKTDNKIWNYSIPRDFSNIASLSFYSDFSSIERLIKKKLNNENDKIIHFSKSVERAYELHKKYHDNSMFVCSNSNKYSKYIDYNKVESMVRSNQFDCKYLFTTTVLDNGFDLKDENIKLIICDMSDIDSMLQCIGRKRFKNNKDKVHIILFNHTNRNLYNYKLSVEKKVKEADAFIDGGVKEYIKLVGKFSKGSNHIIKDNVSSEGKYKSNKTVSITKYLQSVATSNRISEMLDNNRETNKYREVDGHKKESDAYMMYIADLLKKNKITILEKEQKQEDLCVYLDRMVGKRIYKDEQLDVLERFNLRDYDNRLQKEINQLQAYLMANKIMYSIASFKDNRKLLDDASKNSNRGKYYWSISKHEEKIVCHK